MSLAFESKLLLRCTSEFRNAWLGKKSEGICQNMIPRGRSDTRHLPGLIEFRNGLALFRNLDLLI